MTQDFQPNAEAIEAWDTVLFDKFMRFRPLVTEGLGRHGDAAIARLAPTPGSRVIDLGCGFGDSSQQLARLVGPDGSVVGVDAAPRFIEGATQEAAAAGLPNLRFFAADVQTADLGGPYDFAFSRFGTMFFASPVQALRNVARSLVSGGKIGFVVWRKREDNAWLHEAEKVVRAIVPEPETHDAPTCGPGPFSMSGADTVSDILLAAGFRDISLDRTELPILIGRDFAEAIEFAIALGPAGELIRLAGAEGERRRPQVVAALRDALAQFETSDGVVAPASTWVITAYKAQ
jgi:ubiquinone/menaquinone biosynthesis C-methylase UbiE